MYSDDTYKKAMEQIAFSIVISTNGEVRDANNLFLMTFGIKAVPAPLYIYEFESGQFNKDYYERILEHISKGYTWRDEVKMSYQGREAWVDINLAPLKAGDENSCEQHILLIGLDITERKKNEEIIKMQQQQLFTQSQFSALGEMASGIAHEINNPLTIISASATLVSKSLEQGSIDKEFVSELMGEVDHTVKRISKIIGCL